MEAWKSPNGNKLASQKGLAVNEAERRGGQGER
jgi:hypothetical protein